MNRRIRRVFVWFCCCLALITVRSQSIGQAQEKPAAKIFRAGAATSNITPPLGEPIVGGFNPFPSQHVHDELHARCLVLDNGETRVAIVLCDNVGIPREVYDAAKSQLVESAGIAKERMLMAATHTHSATSARSDQRLAPAEKLSDYQQFLVRRIVEGVRRAVNNLEPAKIAWGSAQEPTEVFNRRWFMTPGSPELVNPFGGTDQVKMNPPRAHANLLRPAGPVDPEVAFISVQSASGRPIALLANYSLHYVGGTGNADISADYFAVFADRIQQLLGADRSDPPFVGIMSNGTSGNINNINFRSTGERRKPYEKMREVADKVAQAVYEAHRKVTFHDWVPLGGAARDLSLASRKPTAAQLERARAVISDENAKLVHPLERHYARRMITLNEAPAQVAVPLQTLRIGDLGIGTIPFEVFVETGIELKEKGPFKQTFTISLANGSYGYLPTPEHHVLGGYETWLGTNLVETEASMKIVATLLQLFAGLKEK